MIDLEIPGMNDGAQGGAEGYSHSVGDAVADPEPADLKVPPELIGNIRIDGFHGGAAGGPVFLQLDRNEAVSQAGGIDRHIQLRQHKGQSADMILMAVGDEDGPDMVGPFHQIGNIGNNQVHAQLFLGGKLDAAVDDDNIVAALQGHHIFADFAQAAQGDDAESRILVLVQVEKGS